MDKSPSNPSADRIAWTDCPFVRCLFPQLYAAGPCAASDQQIMEALYFRALATARRVLRGSATPASPSAEEVVSDLVFMFATGFTAPSFDPLGDAEAYLAGIIRTIATSHDRKHRCRSVATLDAAHAVVDGRAAQPLETVSRRECLELVMAMWPLLTPSQQNAIRVQFGLVFVYKGTPVDEKAKNHLAKHRGIRRLRRLLVEAGAVEM